MLRFLVVEMVKAFTLEFKTDTTLRKEYESQLNVTLFAFGM